MLFPVLKFESKVQVDDQTRLDASKSYVSQDEAALTIIEIDPDGTGYINVTATKYLDWQFAVAGTTTATVRIDNGTTPVTKSYDITVVTAATDSLISNDESLSVYEPDLLSFVRPGRNSYKDVHRRVDALILDWLDSNRLWKTNGDRYVKADLIDQQDFKEWATFWALQLIFEGLSDKVDDKWAQKAGVYKALAKAACNRGTLRLDSNGSGEITSGEKFDNISKGLIRA